MIKSKPEWGEGRFGEPNKSKRPSKPALGLSWEPSRGQLGSTGPGQAWRIMGLLLISRRPSAYTLATPYCLFFSEFLYSKHLPLG